VVAGTFIIDSHDISEAEELLSATYARVRLSEKSDGVPTRTRVWRTEIGSLDVDDLEYSYDMRYELDPPEMILLCRVFKGAIEDHRPGQQPEMFNGGEVVAIGALDSTAYGGFVHRATFTAISIDRNVLSEVAAPSRHGEVVRLTSSAPVSAEASRHLVDVVDHVRHTVANSRFSQEPFLAGTVARYLAASMLTTFPNTAVAEPSLGDRHDNAPVLLRRATAFIDENAHTDISPADIAAAADATPQALLNMFRLHRNCTTMDYVRRVRLHHAHRDIVDRDRETTSVAEIARRWGFPDIEMFMRRYVQAYGDEPPNL
jgi:AraC-like DNA-binding protein